MSSFAFHEDHDRHPGKGIESRDEVYQGWVLLTSLAVDTFEDAWQIIEDYENRWLVEEYHKVLKTGCSIELHALRTADRLEHLVAGRITRND